MPDGKEGTLAWYQTDLAARREAFARMVENPGSRLMTKCRWSWPTLNRTLGYMAWLLAENHPVLRKQTTDLRSELRALLFH